jgi:hypothetical protein
MLGVVIVWAGLAVVAVATASLVKPLACLRLRTRRRSALALGAGLALSALGLLLPATQTQVEVMRTHLDEFAPAYHFSEFHRIHIRASRDRVYEAVKEVTAAEILFFRTLTWIRRLGRPGPESVLDAPEHQPLIQVATRTSFLMLADDPDREVLVGTVVLAPSGAGAMPDPTSESFKALDAPGFAKAMMNFRFEDAGSQACLLTTETRVYATDASARRRFAAYWRVIYPGSSLIRWMWLRAVKRRAETACS